MRKNARITRLEQQVEQLSAVVQELLEISTQPTTQPTPKVTVKDWRSKPRRKVQTQNARKDWKREDIAFLAEMLNKGVSRKEIARLTGRTERAVGGAIARHLKVN